MTVVSVLIASLAVQGAAKAPDMRVIEVKPAGLAVSVPKSWGTNPKEANITISLKIPIPGSKNFGRMEIGYVSDDSGNVDGFLEAAKNVLTVGGNTVERQWKVDIMDSPLALTRFSKDGATTVRGVLFRKAKAKFVITISSVTDEFPKVEPFLLSTLETMKEIKVVQPKEPVVAVERKIKIQKETVGKAQKLPVTQALVAGTKNVVMNFPSGTKVTKINDSTVSAVVPGTEASVVLTAHSSEVNSPSNVYQAKTAESSKLFTGAIQRVDETFQINPDKQIRDFVWRTGLSIKDSAPLMTSDCVITQLAPLYVYAFFTSSNAAQFKKEQKAVTDFLKTVNLIEKP